MLEKTGRENYLSTLDLASGYDQIEVEHHNISETAFKRRIGEL